MWNNDPLGKLHRDFFVLELPPNEKHKMWVYVTVGMSMDREDENLIELIVYSSEKNNSIVELLTLNASFHKNSEPLNLHHTVNIGKGISYKAACDHAFISLPYLDGEALEHFRINDKIVHVYWLIPITQNERDYKIEQGCEALEQLFEDRQLNYLDFNRKSLI